MYSYTYIAQQQTNEQRFHPQSDTAFVTALLLHHPSEVTFGQTGLP